MFTLYGLIELMKARKKKLYCTFIDFSKAFDSVWRIGLWDKLIQNGRNGKCFHVIYNMYQGIKSCVSAHTTLTDYFSCSVGVRQGENVSPLLFSLFVNDIEQEFRKCDCRGISVDELSIDYLIDTSIVLFVLLYADDTVLFANNYQDMQNLLNVFDSYCTKWKLIVNCKKTKVLIFNGNKKDYKNVFYLDKSKLDNIESYTYLGIIFHKSNRLTKARNMLYIQAEKAMYFVLRQGRYHNISIQCQLKLFDSMVCPFFYMVAKFGDSKNFH